MKRLWGTVLGCLALVAACNRAPSDQGGADTAAPLPKTAVSASGAASPSAEASACVAEGGRWREQSMISNRMICDRPAPDAGKACTDGGQCASNICEAKGACFDRMTSVGHCVTSVLEHGKVVSGVCAD